MTKYECMEWLFSHFDETENNLLSLPCMIEEWKDILGYEGLYQISNLGRVKSLERKVNAKEGGERTVREKIKGTRLNIFGYPIITLYKCNKMKTYSVHRLVAETFIPNPQGLPQVNHKDEDKTNNTVENLEWCTAEYNVNYGTAIKRRIKSQLNRTDLSRPIMCIETGIVYPSTKEVQRQFGYNPSNLSACCNNKLPHAYGCHWKYI